MIIILIFFFFFFFKFIIEDDVVEVYEGDTAKFNCPSDLAVTRGVDWFHQGLTVDARHHSRCRYSKKR